MKKRLTDIDKWDDMWSRKMKPAYRELYHYICDRADISGVWTKDFDMFRYHTGWKINEVEALEAINTDPTSGQKIRVVPIGDKHWGIVGFLHFHYGDYADWEGIKTAKKSNLITSVEKIIQWHKDKHGFPDELFSGISNEKEPVLSGIEGLG